VNETEFRGKIAWLIKTKHLKIKYKIRQKLDNTRQMTGCHNIHALLHRLFNRKPKVNFTYRSAAMLVVYCGMCSMLNYFFSLKSYPVQDTVLVT